MFRKNKTSALKDSATSASEFAASLAKDKKFRKELLSAVGYGTRAQRRASKKVGLYATAMRFKDDARLRRDVERMVTSLNRAMGRVEMKRSHKLRNTLLVVGLGGAAAAAATRPEVRNKVTGAVPMPSNGFGGSSPRALDESLEVNVPVSVAYNQWTQFEDFPLFMEGVDHVQQVDDTRLHWVANVAGKKAEWDAKILEQHPDRQISWISEDGKKTRGTVTFEPIGESRTRVQLSMSYQAEGIREAIGSAAGLDTRRVRGDLERFKDLIEGRGH